jgi:hypothetical protein
MKKCCECCVWAIDENGLLLCVSSPKTLLHIVKHKSGWKKRKH